MVNTKQSAKGKGKAVASDSPAKKKGEKRAREESSQPMTKDAVRADNLDVSLSRCKMQATRFIDWKAMARLGVKHDLEMMFTTLGINRYMHQVEFTHASETLQFMTSLAPHADADEEGDPDDDYTAIYFTIHGKSYRLNMPEIREIYGFTATDVSEEDTSDKTGMLDLWHHTASGDFRQGKSKGSCIRNPAIRLAQRALGFSFFGRHEVGQVTGEEWRMVCNALRPHISELEPPVRYIPRIDPTYVFVGNLFRARDQAGKRKPEGWVFCLGGVLTPMFRHCGIKLTEPLRPIPMIDQPHLRSSNFLSRAHQYTAVYPFTWDGRHQQLPLPARDVVDITEPDNILFHHILDGVPPPDPTDDDDDAPPGESSHDHGPSRYDHPFRECPQTPIEKEMVKHMGFLKRWIKWQGRTITKMASAIKSLKGSRRHPERQRGESSRAGQDGSTTPESSNPSLDISTPPASDDESDST